MTPPIILRAISAGWRRSVFHRRSDGTRYFADEHPIRQVKCSGEKAGCSRCKAGKAACVYTKTQKQRRSASDMAQWTEDTRAQRRAFSQQQDHARPLDSLFRQGIQTSQSSGDRNGGSPKNAPTPGRSIAQPTSNHPLPSAASSSEPGLDADCSMSESMQTLLPQYEPSSMEDGEDEFGFGLESFSVMAQNGILPFDGSNQSSQLDTIHRDSCESSEENESYSGGQTQATSRSSASQPSNTMTTQLLEGTAPGSPFHQRSPTSSPFTPDTPCLHNDPFSRSQECPVSPSMSLRKRKTSLSRIPTTENCRCLQEIGTLLSGLEHHRSRPTTASLDSILSYHKSALAQLSALIACPKCLARCESLVLLGVVCEKSTTLCERMLSQLLYDPASSPKGEPMVETGETSGIIESRALGTAKKTFLGDYEVTSASEWHLLMKVLFGSQVGRLWYLLNHVKCSIGPLPNGAHFASLLVPTEKRIRGMAAKLTSRNF